MAHSYSPVNFPNDWTPVSMAAANQVPDSPLDSSGDNVGNYATWNPLMPVVSTAAYTFTQGNRDVDITGYDCICNSTLIVDVEDSDGFYAEIDVSNLGSTTTWYAGINTDPDARTQASNIVNDANTYFVRADGGKYNTSVSAGYAGTLAASDTLQVIIKSGSLYFGKAGTGWADGSGGWTTSDFASATAAFTGLTGYVSLCVANSSTSDNGFTLNAGQSAYTGTPPTGTKNWATCNLPAPTVTDPSAYFGTLTWTGNATDLRSITGLADASGTNWTPDFTWIKSRSNAVNHYFDNVLTGFSSSTWLETNTDATEGNSGAVNGYVDQAESGGFRVRNGSTNNVYVNQSSYTYVAWCMKFGGAGVSNTDGTENSTVSVAAHGGAALVKYQASATPSAGNTVGHGMTAAPEFIIAKARDRASQNWEIYHKDEADRFYLNTTGAASGTNVWNSTAPSTSVVTLSAENGVNGASSNYIMACFARTSGLIGIGSYVGNGSADGPYVVVDDGGSGFRPAWVIIKRVDSTSSWTIYDAVRSTYNPVTHALWAEATTAESPTADDIDFVANGFKPRSTATALNASGGTYVYISFAEYPFGGSGVAQARAR